MLIKISDFFGFHSELILGKNNKEVNFDEAQNTLNDWTRGNNELYMIESEKEIVGFLRIAYRGDSVAWIEDIYVDECSRGKGIGTKAIALAEDIVKAKDGYKAICFDVVPRNEAALKLYHKLGYNNLSILTVRKEFGDSKRDKDIKVLGLDFKY